MSGPRRALRPQLQQKHYVGRSRYLCIAQHRQQIGYQIRPVSNLPRLAASQGLQQLQPRPTSHLLWMRSSHSRSSDLSSSSESIRRLPLTIPTYGKSIFVRQTYYMNMNTSLLVSVSVFISTFPTSFRHKHRPTATLLYYTKLTLQKLFITKSKPADISARLQRQQLKLSLVHSNHLPCLLSPNPGVRINIVYYRTYRSLSPRPLLFQTHQLIRSLIRIISLLHGAHSQSHHSFSPVYHPTRRLPPGIYPKPIAAHLFTTLNGHLMLYVLRKMPTVLTRQLASAQDPQAASMVTYVTHHLPSSDHRVWALSTHGSMTTFLRESNTYISMNITNHANFGMQTSYRGEGATKQEAEHGTAVTSLTMVPSRNSLKIADTLCLTYPNHPPDQPTTNSTLTTLPTSTIYPHHWVYHGNEKKTCRLLVRPPTLALYGTLPPCGFPYHRKRRQNTWPQYRTGQTRRLTSSTTLRNCMGNYYTPAQSFQEAALFSPNWRPCWGSSILILSAQYHPQSSLPTTSTGGPTSSSNPTSAALSPHQLHSSTLERSLMRALELVSPSRSVTDGEHGASSLGGQQRSTGNETSLGPKPSVLSASSGFSFRSAMTTPTFSSTAITTELSKGGGTTGAETERSTKFSGEYINSSSKHHIPSHSIQFTSQANLTQQMHHPEVSILPTPYSSLTSHSHPNSMVSSLTLPLHTPHLNSDYTGKEDTPKPWRRSSAIRAGGIRKAYQSALTTTGSSTQTHTSHSQPSRFNTPLQPSSKNESKISKPQPYRPHLTPRVSPLRPHCLAGERLKLWQPAGSSHPAGHGSGFTLSDEDVDRIINIMNVSWSKGTRETYGAGLLVYHVFCDMRQLPEAQRAPAAQPLILAFISSLAGSYSGSTLSNYVCSVRAWHILHGLLWNMDDSQLKAALTGASNLAPPTSKRAKRLPITVQLLVQLLEHLDPNVPLDAAIRSCITTVFYTAARLGEFTVPSLTAFDSKLHITPADVSEKEDRHKHKVTAYQLPKTKSSAVGEEVSCASQEGPSDPNENLQNHLRINNPPNNGHLFAYKHGNGHRPLTKSALMQRLNTIAKTLGLDDLKGHRFRIGATLEYLLRGLPFDVVKTHGRWKGDSFTLYLRRHAVILAPYIQNHPILEPFTRYTMPAVRR